jgi:hypothetical protein
MSRTIDDIRRRLDRIPTSFKDPAAVGHAIEQVRRALRELSKFVKQSIQGKSAGN